MKKRLYFFLLSLLCLTNSSYATKDNDTPLLIIGDSVYYATDYFDWKQKSWRSKQKTAYDFIRNKIKLNRALEMGFSDRAEYKSELENHYLLCAKKVLIEESSNELLDEADFTYRQIFRPLSQEASNREVFQESSLLEELLHKISAGSSSFKQLQKEHSKDTCVHRVSHEEVLEELEVALNRMEEGEVSGVIESPEGLHLVLLCKKGEVSSKRDLLQRTTSRLEQEFQLNLDSLMSELEIDSEGLKRALRTTDVNQVLCTKVSLDYSYDNLMKLNPALKEEFRVLEENLLITLYEKELLLKGGENPKELEEFFLKNQKRYKWKPARLLGGIVYVPTKKEAKRVRKLLLKNQVLDKRQVENILKEHYPAAQVETTGLLSPAKYALIERTRYGKRVVPVADKYAVVFGDKVKRPIHYEDVLEDLLIDYHYSLDMEWLKDVRQKTRLIINEKVLKSVNNEAHN